VQSKSRIDWTLEEVQQSTHRAGGAGGVVVGAHDVGVLQPQAQHRLQFLRAAGGAVRRGGVVDYLCFRNWLN